MEGQINSDLPHDDKKGLLGPRDLLVIVLGLLVMATTAGLGRWQLDRAHEKAALHRQLDQREIAAPLQVGKDAIDLDADAWRRAQARGVYAPAMTVYLQNRQQDQETGFWVLTPLKIAGSNDYVMVLRGWIPRNFEHMDEIARYRTPLGQTMVDGLVAPPPSQWFSFFPDPPQAVIRQNINMEQYARFHHIALLPFVLRQSGDLNDGLGRRWPAINTGIATNYGYALQWFAMCATAGALLAYFLFRRLRRTRGVVAR